MQEHYSEWRKPVNLKGLNTVRLYLHNILKVTNSSDGKLISDSQGLGLQKMYDH